MGQVTDAAAARRADDMRALLEPGSIRAVFQPIVRLSDLAHWLPHSAPGGGKGDLRRSRLQRELDEAPGARADGGVILDHLARSGCGEHRGTLEQLALALLRNEVLLREDIDRIMAGTPRMERRRGSGLRVVATEPPPGD